MAAGAAAATAGNGNDAVAHARQKVANAKGTRTIPREVCHNYVGNKYGGHTYIGHDCICHTQIGHNCYELQRPRVHRLSPREVCRDTCVHTRV